jgi:putative addiction module antidote
MAVKEIKLNASGNSTAAILPKPMLDNMHVAQGDTVFAIEVENGVLLTPYDPTFAKAMEIASEAMRTYRNALKELATK